MKRTFKNFLLLLSIFAFIGAQTLIGQVAPHKSDGHSKNKTKNKVDTLSSIDFKGFCTYVHGTPTTPGATLVSNNGKTVEMKAHGSEIGHHCGEDQGRFAYTTLKGNFDIIVQIEKVTNLGAKKFYENTFAFAKAGIMAREGIGTNDRYVAIWVRYSDFGEPIDAYHYDLRKTPGAWLGNQDKECKHAHKADKACDFVYGCINERTADPKLFKRDFPNVWLRLQRSGNKFTATLSQDGKTWNYTTIPDHEIEFAETLYIGVALSAASEGSPDAYAEATFKIIKGL